jgi:hypothetical protein
VNLRRGQSERPTIVEVGDLRLDPATHQVWRGETEIELSAKEFVLFETFMRRPGYVLTRSQLLDQAWEYDFEHRSNLIEVYIRYLRRKIDLPPSSSTPIASASTRRWGAWSTTPCATATVRAGKIEDEDGIEDRSQQYQRLMHELFDAQRETLIELRNRGEVSNEVMREVERELDLEESRLDS